MDNLKEEELKQYLLLLKSLKDDDIIDYINNIYLEYLEKIKREENNENIFRRKK